MKKKPYIHYLLDKFRSNSISQEEYRELLDYFDKEEYQGDITRYIEEELPRMDPTVDEEKLAASLLKVDSRLGRIVQMENKTKSLFVRLLPYVAAVIALFAGFTLYTLINNPTQTDDVQLTYEPNIAPGDNHAILTLEDGSSIELSRQHSGIAMQNGAISYNDGSAIREGSSKTVPLTLKTPKGGQYQITLSDGTNVWLNSASSIQYPNQFDSSAKRIVKLTGEAYFEVSKNPRQPFIVQCERQEIEVLGTHFNVNSYPDENFVKTTLKEGSVRVLARTGSLSSIRESVILKPNQQSAIAKGSNKIQVQEIDVSLATAWKEGYFHFENLQLDQIMRVVGRWYDIDIKYETDVSGIRFSGRFSKKRGLRQILDLMDNIGDVKFKIISDNTGSSEATVVVNKR